MSVTKKIMDSILIDSHYYRQSQSSPLSVEAFHSDSIAQHDDVSKGGEPVVELQNIHKTYLLGVEGVPALRGVSLNIYPGEFIIIFGTSGGGKTSLLNVIGTIDKPTKGELKIDGIVLNGKTSDEKLSSIRLSNLGFVFQTFNLLSSMTALENVELPMILKATLSAAERRQRATDSLKQVGLGHRLYHYPPQLSGGEQQRVTIARAIANSPKLLLLDEPTGDLDSHNADLIMQLLTGLNAEKRMTMIMVTHDMSLKNFADRVVWMRDGKVARVERIAPEKRQAVRKDLLLRLNNDGSAAASTTTTTTTTTTPAGPANTSTVTGGFPDSLISRLAPSTEYRQPAYYKVLKTVPESDSQRHLKSQMSSFSNVCNKTLGGDETTTEWHLGRESTTTISIIASRVMSPQ